MIENNQQHHCNLSACAKYGNKHTNLGEVVEEDLALRHAALEAAVLVRVGRVDVLLGVALGLDLGVRVCEKQS